MPGDFAAWFEKNAIGMIGKQCSCGKYHKIKSNMPVVPTHALGEFAWDYLWEDLSLEFMVKQAALEDWVFNFENVQSYFTEEIDSFRLYWQIAVVCLGKPTVEARLKTVRE